jgi:hypothetical protein
MHWLASIDVPAGIPATRRPPEMQSSIAYSSAIRIAGCMLGSVEPICTIATSRRLVARAGTDPMMFGFGMNP